jgi:hypothetical protein
MRNIIAALMLVAACAAADTIRIRITHEGAGFTNVTTRALTGSNRVEMVKEWVASTGTTNTLDAHIVATIEAQLIDGAKAWKTDRLRMKKIRRIEAEIEAEVE